MENNAERLGRLLDEIESVNPPYSWSAVGKEPFEEICRLTLQDEVYKQVWSERMMNQLERLFETETPDPDVFGPELEEIHRRSVEVREVNDFFFAVLEASIHPEDVCISLSRFQHLPPHFSSLIQKSARLNEIREQELASSAKISLFLEFLKDDLGVDLFQKQAVIGVLQSLQQSETVGNVNAVFIAGNGTGVIMPLHLKVQQGSGSAQCLVRGSESFQDSIQRAQSAMKELGYISGSEDVLYTLHLTDLNYEGSSIAVAAAVGIYSVKRKLAVDPYTTFTGDINIHNQKWVLKPVKSVREKIFAAKRAGCRRVFVPADNSEDANDSKEVKIYSVNSLEEIFVKLHPGKTYRPGNSLYGRKIMAVQQHCHKHGWDLEEFVPIQSGFQTTVMPLELKPVKIQIYYSGTHTPKSAPQPEYEELFSTLNQLDVPEIPIQTINERLNARHKDFQRLLKAELEKFSKGESLIEQYCAFSFKLAREKETLTVKQYTNGTLTIQGSAGSLYKDVLEIIVPLYKIYFTNSNVTVDHLLNRGTQKTIATKLEPRASTDDIPLPYIGTDESGKGDYLGSMVIAGVFLDSAAQTELSKLGVKDSKLLTDKRIRELAANIRNLIPGKYHEVEILPERYNQLYDEFKTEKKNLNHLLAWGHARAIEDLLKRHKSSHAVADQFGDEHYIQSKLMEKGKTLELIQVTKGERYLGVATASILARDKFVARMEILQKVYGTDFPKGASDKVVEAAKEFVRKHGFGQLGKVAKLHHKTTEKIK